MLSQEQKQQFRQEKKEKIIRIRKTLSEMSEEQRQAIADKFGIVTVEGHLLTPHNQCFLVAQSEINFSIVGGFQQWKKAGRIGPVPYTNRQMYSVLTYLTCAWSKMILGKKTVW